MVNPEPGSSTGSGLEAGLSCSATPAGILEATWEELVLAITNPRLQPTAAPTIPPNTPMTLLLFIIPAHNTGLLTARRRPTMFNFPTVNTPAAQAALWDYYQQGFNHGLTLSSLIDNGSPNVPAPRAPRINKPESFDGTRSKFSKFMTRLALVFSSDSTRYATDAAKIAYAASFLTGTAADWFEPHLNKNSGATDFGSYGEFAVTLKNAYDNSDAQATAQRKLRNLKQGDKDCSTYHAEFATYATVLNYDDATKIQFFTKGANHDLKTAIAYQPLPPQTFDQFVQLCIKLDNSMKLLNTRKPQPRAPAPAPAQAKPVPTTATGAAPGPMDLSNAQRRRGHISEEVRRFWCENNLCSYCSGAGHWRADWPARARNQRVNTAAPALPEQPPTKPMTEQGGVPLYEVSKNQSTPRLLMASLGAPGYILVPSTLFPFPLLALILFLS